MMVKRRGSGIALIATIAALVIMGCSGDNPGVLVSSAKEYLAKGDKSAAEIQLKNALQKSPNLAEARFLLGGVLLEAGEAAAAEKELRKALEFKYPADKVNPPLARSLLLQGKFETLISELSHTKASPESTAEFQTSIGQAHTALGDVAAASVAYATALAARPAYPPAQVGQARLASYRGDLEVALRLVDAALQTSPKFSEGWHLKGDLLLTRGSPDEAVGAYRKAVEVDPANLAAHSTLISLFAARGNIEDADKELKAMQQAARAHPQTLYLQAMVSYQQKNYAAARDAIQQHLRLAPDNLPGLTLSGAIAYELKAYAQAEADLRRVLQRSANEGFARRLLIATYLRSGKPAAALETLTPALGQIGNDPAMLTVAGEVYLKNGRAAEASTFFTKASALDPKNGEKQTGLAMAHVAAGDTQRAAQALEGAAAAGTGVDADLALIALYVERRDFDKALAAIAALEKKQPGQASPHNLRGIALAGKGDAAGARKSFERALSLDRAHYPAIANLARLDVADHRPEDARKRFDALLAAEPKNVPALLALADLRARAKAPQAEVAALINKAIAAEPTNAAPRRALISYYLQLRETNKASATAQEALAAFPDRPEILDAVGRAQRAAGETSQAMTTYGKLARLQPESPHPLMRLAEMHVAAKDYETALLTLKKALALKPDFTEAQRGIAALDVATNRVPEALAMAREMQKQKPNDALGYAMEGDIHASQKAWKPALSAYRTGLKRADVTDLAIRLEGALRNSGQVAQANQEAAARLKSHPQDHTFRVYLAQSALSRKEYDTARRHYQALADVHPNNAVILNNLAYIAGKTKDPKALAFAEKAYELAPNQPAIIDTLGMILVDKGDTERGIEMLQQASNLAPQAPSYRLHLAQALLAGGKKAGAKKELQELAKLGDKFPEQAEVARLLKGL